MRPGARARDFGSTPPLEAFLTVPRAGASGRPGARGTATGTCREPTFVLFLVPSR